MNRQLPSAILKGATEYLGAVRDVVRGVQVGYVGPTLQIEKTFSTPATAQQQFSVTVPATMAIDWFTVACRSSADIFLVSISIGAVEYYRKIDNTLAPAQPQGVPPQFNRGLLRRIEVIQGDSILVTVQNTAGAADTCTFWANGYRLGPNC